MIKGRLRDGGLLLNSRAPHQYPMLIQPNHIQQRISLRSSCSIHFSQQIEKEDWLDITDYSLYRAQAKRGLRQTLGNSLKHALYIAQSTWTTPSTMADKLMGFCTPEAELESILENDPLKKAFPGCLERLEPITVPTGDKGIELSGIYIRPLPGEKLYIFFNGREDNVENIRMLMPLLEKTGAGAVVVDPRGTGGSLFENYLRTSWDTLIEDAESLWNYAKTLEDTENQTIPAKQRELIAYSAGGTVATYLLARLAFQKENPLPNLTLIASPASLSALIEDQKLHHNKTPLATIILSLMSKVQPYYNSIQNLSLLKHVQQKPKVTLIHGKQDTDVLPHHSQQLEHLCRRLGFRTTFIEVAGEPHRISGEKLVDILT